MDIFWWVLILLFGVQRVNVREQGARIALLGQHLSRHRIERLMEHQIQGSLRALGESDPQRQAAVWQLLAQAESDLVGQFQAFARDFADVPERQARLSRLALAVPWVTRWLPGASLDVRPLLAVHAKAIARAVDNPLGKSPKDKAYTLMAELLLMQHTCHWFCRSRLVASARLLARHQTPYPQVLGAVDPATRQAYCALVRC